MNEHTETTDGQQPGFPPAAPVENVVRGTVYAAIVVPAGVLAWAILWHFGFIASLVAWVVAAGAGSLYVRGAGRLSRNGAWVVVGMTVLTVVLAFLAGMWLDFVQAAGLSVTDAWSNSHAWNVFGQFLTDSEIWGSYTKDILATLAFAALGSFMTLRRIFAATAKR